ncbi:hypothetical protein ACSS6W_005523 [Trichoderma asperelloides]
MQTQTWAAKRGVWCWLPCLVYRFDSGSSLVGASRCCSTGGICNVVRRGIFPKTLFERASVLVVLCRI